MWGALKSSRQAPPAQILAATGGAPRRPLPFVVLAAMAMLWACVAAGRAAWTCDDAFISFRYAANLVRGLGLVFNAGERVEGYSNFLWTLWLAAGLRLGLDPERWSAVWGILFYVGSVGLLALRSWRRAVASGNATGVIPLAALLAAVHADWQVYATSGLETSLFTFLAVLGFVLVSESTERSPRLALAGVVFGLAALTRSDGVIFAAPAGLFALASSRSRLRAALAFGGAFLAVWIPHIVWRIAYYGDLFPNTWYAKSAASAWYSQGATYLWLYFREYWAIAVGALLAIVMAAVASQARSSVGEPGPGTRWRGEVVLCALLAASYTFWVVRVGGDFMHARLLIPVTPFYLVLAELAILRLVPESWAVRMAALAGVMLAVILTPDPITANGEVAGVVNEKLQYPRELCQQLRRRGENFDRYFDGLAVRMPFLGFDARVVYYSNVATAIECATGLTDRFIGHQPLRGRGRVGHEKRPTASYLLSRRQVNFALNAGAVPALGLTDSLPFVPISLGGDTCCLLRWEPELLSALKARGARFPDFPAFLDEYIANMASLPDSVVRRDFEKMNCFYFRRVGDPARLNAIRARLGRRD
jgi:hypothetical protein